MWWNKYIRVPFVEKGRTMEGADCWGLKCLIYKNELGIILPDYSEFYDSTKYEDCEKLKNFMAAEESNPRWHKVDTPREFDGILIRIGNAPIHVGVVTKDNYMLHCAEGVGTTHVKYTSMDWKNRVMGFYRYE